MIYTMDKVASAYEGAFEMLEKDAGWRDSVRRVVGGAALGGTLLTGGLAGKGIEHGMTHAARAAAHGPVVDTVAHGAAARTALSASHRNDTLGSNFAKFIKSEGGSTDLMRAEKSKQVNYAAQNLLDRKAKGSRAAADALGVPRGGELDMGKLSPAQINTGMGAAVDEFEASRGPQYLNKSLRRAGLTTKDTLGRQIK